MSVDEEREGDEGGMSKGIGDRRACVCVYVRERERERVCVKERERERERVKERERKNLSFRKRIKLRGNNKRQRTCSKSIVCKWSM